MKSILEMLAGGGFVSGEKISRELGVSRVAVWKRINQLREQGWLIESGGKRGYRLTAGDSLDPALWAGDLATSRLGRGENRYEKEVTSTNTVIKEMAIAGAPDGSVCVAESQSAGKGRLGRAWSAPAGKGLWVSLLLRQPRLLPEQAPLVTLCAAMAMARAAQEASGVDVRIKWPNDLVSGGRKLCGILLELSADPDRIEYIVVGTGLNVLKGAYPPELAEKAAAIEDFTSPPLRREILARYLTCLDELIARLEQGDWERILAEYRTLSCTLGSTVHVSGAVELTGVAEELDDKGALIVRTADGARHRVLSGDVSVRGVMGYV